MKIRSDEYVRVDVILLHNTEDAILINCNLGRGPERKAWVPFSLLHSVEESKLKNAPLDKVVNIRMRQWKAEQLSLV